MPSEGGSRTGEPQQQPSAGEESTLASRINRLARAIRDMPPGDIAALRRITPDDPAAPAFWKVAAAHLDGALPRADGPERDERERRWASILSGMAMTTGLHTPRRKAGEALAEAGYSELRFERLLRASGEQLFQEVRSAARFLASKAMELDWTDLAALVLSADGPGAEQVRRGLARSFYRRVSQND